MTSKELSPSIAYGCVDLLGLVSRNQISLTEAFGFNFAPASSQSVVNLGLSIGWVEISAAGSLVLSAKGEAAHAKGAVTLAVRCMVLDYIEAHTPPWAQLASYGRNDVLTHAPSGISQLMIEAGLGYGDTEDVVEFWDMLAARARGLKNGILTDIGRKGERLSMEYESQRVGERPKWVALDDNSAGYDILSRVSSSDKIKMSIEVKSSEQSIGSAAFHLTRNEWEMAQDARFHLFHLWLLGRISSSSPRLAVLRIEDVAFHVPSNCGEGSWESVCIPFSPFAERFFNPND